MFNPDKRELIKIISAKLPVMIYGYSILEKKIKVASSVKYLGVHTDEHLNMERTCQAYHQQS